jgi:cytochrome c biogenesis protein CcmG, thiol:disulfide interchange protein DsbE
MRTLRWLLVPLVVLPIAWLLFSGFGRDPRQVASPLVGAPAPAWSLTTPDGQTLSSEDLAGRPYIVNFWASWCLPACVDEQPVLAAAYDRHGDDLAIVGVLFQNAAADAERFLARYGDAGYPHVVDENGTLAIDYGVTGPPETFFVDADGIIRSKVFGPLTNALMAERLAGILQVARR